MKGALEIPLLVNVEAFFVLTTTITTEKVQMIPE